MRDVPRPQTMLADIADPLAQRSPVKKKPASVAGGRL